MAFQPPSAAAPTTITYLGDDLLREIFLRLPALPSLVRAASACRAFRRAVRSSQTFRRSFHALHGPPLLALFFDTFMKVVPVFPSPPPWRHPDRDLFAVNFFNMFRIRAAGPGWEIDASIQTNCGYVALVNGSTSQRAIYNPLTQGLKIYPRPPTPVESILHGTQLEFHTLTGEDGQRSSRVVCVRRSHLWARPHVAVFSSGTMEWQFFPETKTLLQVNEMTMDITVLRGFVCWAHWMKGHILVLDTATLQFSLMDLPMRCSCGGGCTALKLGGGCTALKLGETKDGKLCIVGITEKSCVAWLWAANNNGGVGEKWIKYKMFLLGPIVKEATKCTAEEEGHIRVGVVGVIDGFVYLSVSYSNGWDKRYRMLLSLCIETAETKELLKDGISRYEHAHPYIMAWPPSLVQIKEESETEVIGDSVAGDAPVDLPEASSVLVTALQSFKEAMMNGDEENAVEMAAFVLSIEDEKSSLLTKIKTMDAQFTTLRDRILRTSA